MYYTYNTRWNPKKKIIPNLRQILRKLFLTKIPFESEKFSSSSNMLYPISSCDSSNEAPSIRSSMEGKMLLNVIKLRSKIKIYRDCNHAASPPMHRKLTLRM